IAEDEKGMAQILKRGLEEEGYHVLLAADGATALQIVRRQNIDLLVLDVMLPVRSGLEVARELRDAGQETPILMLTARDSVPDIVRGLDAGADDYLTKPFSFEVLLARIRALERRAAHPRLHLLQIGNLTLNPAEHRVFRG